jgi:hypothetical protein
MKKKYFKIYSKNEKYKLIYLFIKISLLISIIFIILEKKYIFIDGINLVNFINNQDFQFMKDINKNKFNLILSKKKNRIEIIFILIQAIPYINKKIIIEKKNNEEVFEILKNIFHIEKLKKDILYIRKNNIDYIIQNFNELIYYKWEYLPNTNLINSLRYIISNYYNENCLELFDKALNLNFEDYINKNKSNFTSKNINKLMSKFVFILFFIRKYWNL